MDVLSFANKYLYPYKTKGNEIIPKLCPFCNGGSHGDIETFALNTDKLAYVCLRGSCGETGTFNQLLRHMGEMPERMDYQLHKPKPRQYKKPQPIQGQLSPEVIDYLAKRKISKKTLDKWKVTEKDSRIIFNYYNQDNELVFRKYRTNGKDAQWTREADTMPILYGMWAVDVKKPVVLVEGELDALAVSESGIDNVVSVPSGANDFTWVENCWEWLEQVNDFVLFGDTDEPGREMIKKLIIKLGEDRCRKGENKYKDANELLYREGAKAVKNAIECAKPIPKMGILSVSDIERKRGQSLGIPTGFKGLDRKIEDAQLGGLTIWTGRSGDGKSTILGQVILEALDFGVSVFAYSGELNDQTFQEWVNTQAAGPENLESYKNHYGDVKYEVKADVEKQIKEWYRERFFLYDNTIKDKNIPNTGIIDLCKYASKRHDCKVFIIDNLMSVQYDSVSEGDFYLEQSRFVCSLKNFAKSYNVHVHVVIHPKKTEGDLDKNSIAGRADVTNLADNVIAIEKNKDKEESCDGVLTLLKNRKTGQLIRIKLKFDDKSKRFCPMNKDGEVEVRKPYNWLKYPKWVEDAEKATQEKLFS